MPFLDSLDIANRALQLLGAREITDVDEDSTENTATANAYDKLRRPELRRNVWRFATKRCALRALDSNTRILDPRAWSDGTTYLLGEIVKDDNDILWQAVQPSNIGAEPGLTTAWEQYFGPLTVSLYDADITYYAGELVYKVVGTAGGYVVYMSLENNNEDNPTTVTDYDATVTYGKDEVVNYLGTQFRSLIDVNLGVTPDDGPSVYSALATYNIGDEAVAQDGFIYTSTANGNIGHDPVLDGGVHWTKGVANAWSSVPTIEDSSRKWRALLAGAYKPSIVYPVGAGPSDQDGTKNMFRLPAGYLRVANQDPKAGAHTLIGAPTGRVYEEWLFEGNYIIWDDPGPIIFRFVADVSNVREMDDMFCEGLACRIAVGVCERVTQSTGKISIAAKEYEKFMGDARLVNAIEVGAEEPPEDDLIVCRR